MNKIDAIVDEAVKKILSSWDDWQLNACLMANQKNGYASYQDEMRLQLNRVIKEAIAKSNPGDLRAHLHDMLG